jgi:hypothetical protein
LNVWLAERAAFAEEGVEDVFFHECSDRFPVGKLDLVVGKWCVRRSIKTGPEDCSDGVMKG